MCDVIEFRVRRRGLEWDSCGSIKQSDLDDIKNIFPGILRSLPIAKQLLLVLWIREIKFATHPLTNDEMFDYVQGVFASSDIDINCEEVLKELNVLIDNGYLHDVEEEDDDYPLTAEGGRVAEEMFEMLKILRGYLEIDIA